MASRLTKACTVPDRPKPSTSGQRVSQNMKKPSCRPRPMASSQPALANSTTTSDLRRGQLRACLSSPCTLYPHGVYAVRPWSPGAWSDHLRGGQEAPPLRVSSRRCRDRHGRPSRSSAPARSPPWVAPMLDCLHQVLEGHNG